MRTIRYGLGAWAVIVCWAWLFGPVGFVAGGVAFLGGWALGHRTGRHDAEREHYRAWHAYGRPESYPRLHSVEEGDR